MQSYRFIAASVTDATQFLREIVSGSQYTQGGIRIEIQPTGDKEEVDVRLQTNIDFSTLLAALDHMEGDELIFGTIHLEKEREKEHKFI